MANNLTQSKWADHLRGCADMAVEIAKRMDIREDPARQAMLATIIISSDRHNIFLEPIPESQVEAETSVSIPPIESPRPAPVRPVPPVGEVEGENQGAIRNATPEQAESANRGALLAGINSARELLFKTDPKFTPAGLNTYILEKMKIEGGLGVLDVDQLADLTERLSKRIDANKKKSESNTNKDELEGWPDAGTR